MGPELKLVADGAEDVLQERVGGRWREAFRAPRTTTAGTCSGPAPTLEWITRAIGELEALPPVDRTPMRLTVAEFHSMASQLGVQLDPTVRPDAYGVSLLGIPVVLIPDHHGLARIFTLHERIERKHWMLWR